MRSPPRTWPDFDGLQDTTPNEQKSSNLNNVYFLTSARPVPSMTRTTRSHEKCRGKKPEARRLRHGEQVYGETHIMHVATLDSEGSCDVMPINCELHCARSEACSRK